MRFLRSTAQTFISSVFRSFVSLLIAIVTSRLLGPEGNGVVGVANNFLFFATLILGFGMSTSSTFFAAKRQQNLGKIVANNIAIALLTLVVLVPFYFLNAHFHFGFLKGLNNTIVFLLLLITPVSNLSLALISIFLGLQNIAQYNRLSLIDKILNFLLLLILVLIARNPTAAIVATLVENILVCFLAFRLLKFKYRYRIRMSVKQLRHMLTYGIKAQIGNVIQMLNYRLDVFVINYFLPISQVGIYAIAVSLAETIWKITGSIAIMAFPMASAASSKKDTSVFLNRVTRISVVLITVFALFLALICKVLILLLFGKKFSGAVAALLWLLPGVAVYSVANILANYLAGVNHVEKNIFSATVSCVITVVLDLILIPRMGINGASIATSISYTIYTVITVFNYTRCTGSRLRDVLVVRKEDVVLVVRTVVLRFMVSFPE